MLPVARLAAESLRQLRDLGQRDAEGVCDCAHSAPGRIRQPAFYPRKGAGGHPSLMGNGFLGGAPLLSKLAERGPEQNLSRMSSSGRSASCWRRHFADSRRRDFAHARRLYFDGLGESKKYLFDNATLFLPGDYFVGINYAGSSWNVVPSVVPVGLGRRLKDGTRQPVSMLLGIGSRSSAE